MASTYTVEAVNELLGTRRYEGVFESYGAAEEHAKAKAARSRSFAVYQVMTGTPKSPGKEVGPAFRGS